MLASNQHGFAPENAEFLRYVRVPDANKAASTDASSASSTHEASCCASIFRKVCRTRHLITWTLISSLLAGVAVFLFVYAVPLVDKAHEVADEALDITSLARDKLEGIDGQVRAFLAVGAANLNNVSVAANEVQGLALRMHDVLDELEKTNAQLQAQMASTPPPAPGAGAVDIPE